MSNEEIIFKNQSNRINELIILTNTLQKKLRKYEDIYF